MGASLCRLRKSNIFDARATFGVDARHDFAQSVLATVPLIRGVFGAVVTRACTGYWAGLPLWLSRPCRG